MIPLLLALVSLGWAGPTDASLSIERAKAAMARNWPVQGRDLALEALEQDPSSEMAWRVYLRSSAMMGMGAIAEAEVQDAAERDRAAEIAWAWWQVKGGERTADDLEALADTDGGRIAWAWVSYNASASLAALDILPDRPNNEMVARLQIRAHAERGRSKTAVRLAKRWMRDNPQQPQVVVEIWAADKTPAVERFKRRAVAQTQQALRENPDNALLNYRALRLFAAARIHPDSKAVVDQIGALGLERPLYRTLWSAPMREGMGHVLGMKRDGTLLDGTDDELLDITQSWTESLVKQEKFEAAEAAWKQLSDRVQTAEVLLAEAQFLQQMENNEAAIRQAHLARELAAQPPWNDRASLDAASQALLLADVHGLMAELGMQVRDPKMARTAAVVAHGLDSQQRWATLRAGLDALPFEGATALPKLPLTQATVDSLMAPYDAQLTVERAQQLEAQGYGDAAFVAWSVARAQGASVEDAVARTYRGIGDSEVAAQAAVLAQKQARKAYRERLATLHQARDEQITSAVARPGPGFRLPNWEAQGADGGRVDSRDLAGHAYLLTFWASWCGPCLQELPLLNEAVSGTALQVVALSTDAKQTLWQRAYRKHRWTSLTHAWAPGLAAKPRIEQIPTAYVVDAEGRISRVFVGYHPGGVPDMIRALQEAE